MQADKEAFFTETVNEHIKEIHDGQIGVDKVIEYIGKKFELSNKEDYQHVIKRYCGNFFDVEGEAKFSDYFPVQGPKEFLSLGWLSYTGKRADIHPKYIDLSEIEIS